MIKKIIIWLITLYKKTPLSTHGYCKYTPSCSTYAIEAIEEYGVIKGGFMSVKRILKCNPFSKGGYDPVIKRRKK